MNNDKIFITVEATIEAPVEKVWQCFTDPKHITQWNNASVDWHTTRAENDVRVGGKFLWRMEAKDGSFGFDFEGVYNEVKENNYLQYTLADDRNVKVDFTEQNDLTKVIETFEAETTHPVDLQMSGWQAILNNFKKYVETA